MANKVPKRLKDHVAFLDFQATLGREPPKLMTAERMQRLAIGAREIGSDDDRQKYEPGQRSPKDEARRLASKFAKLPDLSSAKNVRAGSASELG